MLKLEKYIDVSGESRRNIFLKLADGRLLRKIVDGDLYIIQPSEISMLNAAQKKIILSDKKKEWDSRISFAHQNPELKADVITEIKEDVSGFEKMGFKIVGYNEKTLYKKIATGKTQRRTRKDKSTVKNSILSNPNIQNKVLEMAKPLYLKDTRGSIRLLADRIQYAAKQREDLYEIAAIPFPTLYRFLNNTFTNEGMKEAHERINHFDQWNKKRLYVEDAFTKDIDFMDWIAFDDHMIQISGVKVFNEQRGIVELKTIYSWFAMESKTMMPVAYDIKVGEFNSNDIKLLFMKTLMNVGKPVKGFMFDNGLAAASPNLQMLNHLGINYHTTTAYTPTGKATMERLFGQLNSECIVYLNNYIGGKRIDGRHRTLKLSPEESHLTEKDLIDLIDKYINGFFLDRPRTRKIGSETKRISTREYYDKEYQNFVPEFCEEKDLKFAFMDGEVKKFNGQMIKLGKHGIYAPDEALPPYLNNRYYKVKYNPFDMNSIDMYNIDPIKIGDYILESGKLVATLYAFANKGNIEKQAIAKKVWKSHSKALKDAAQTTTDLMLVEDIEKAGLISTSDNLIDTRKGLKKRVYALLEDETKKLIKADVLEASIKPEDDIQATELSYETEESELTFERESNE